MDDRPIGYRWGFDGRRHPVYGNNTEQNRRLRQERLEAARKKGTHFREEWELLISVFSGCVICGIPYDQLAGGRPTKDHIEPLFLGGCDCIGNLQPVCRSCNSGKYGCEDMRNRANPAWFGKYRLRFSEMVRGRSCL